MRSSRMIGIAAVLWLLLVGCSDSSSGRDAAPEQLTEEQCRALSDQWLAERDKLDLSCTTNLDCGMAGGTFTCSCAPALGGDCGHAIQRASYIGSAAQKLEERFYASCQYPAICDCPPPDIECSPQGRCIAITRDSCFPPDPPDAGPDASNDAGPDAGIPVDALPASNAAAQ